MTLVKLPEIQRSPTVRDIILSRSLRNGQTIVKSDLDRARNMDTEDEYIQIDHARFYVPKIQKYENCRSLPRLRWPEKEAEDAGEELSNFGDTT